MPLSGKVIESLVRALADAFDPDTLEELVRYELDERLHNIAGGQTHRQVVFHLVQWAESRDQLGRLMEGALERAPDHTELRAAASALGGERSSVPAGVLMLGVPTRNPYFTGRDDLLQAIHTHFESEVLYAITGLGGIGKTQTAVEFVYRYGQMDFQSVFWVSADSQTSLTSGYSEIAYVLRLAARSDTNQTLTVQAALNWMAANSGWLLVLDNIESPALVRHFLPKGGRGRVLLTSRSIQTAVLGVPQPLRLDPLTTEEATQFLKRRTGRSSVEEPERVASVALVAALGSLPLALEQAGSYLASKEATFQSYLKSFQKRSLAVLNAQLPETGEYDASVATTWALNFSEIEKSAASAELLRLTSVLHPDAIPLELLTCGSAALGPVLRDALADVQDDPLVLDDLLEPLARLSLIRRDNGQRTWRTHRLVQQVLCDQLSEGERKDWASRAVCALETCFPESDFAVWNQCERLVPHVRLAIASIRKDGIAPLVSASLLGKYGEYLRQRGRYAEANEALPYALDLLRSAEVAEDVRLIEATVRLALLRQQTHGGNREAEMLFRSALDDLSRLAPEDVSRRSWIACGLGSLLHSQGRFDEAEVTLREAVDLAERSSEAGNRHRAAALNALAALYFKKRQLGEAEELLLRLLGLQRSELHAGHPDLARTLNNLAALLDLGRRPEEAERAYREALTIREQALGQDHPDTAVSLGNLGRFFATQGRLEEAEPLLKRVLDIRLRTLEPSHARTADVLENLAALYQDQGRLEEAEPLLLRAVCIREEADPPDPRSLENTRQQLEQLRPSPQEPDIE